MVVFLLVGFAQHSPFSHDLLLSQKLGEIAGNHAGGKRSLLLKLLISVQVEEVHAPIVPHRLTKSSCPPLNKPGAPNGSHK
jgi:hypothetical protein